MATDMHIGGKPDPHWRGLEYEFAPGGRWVIYRKDREDSGGPRSYAADPKAKPAAIDLTEDKSTYPGAYQVEPGGDALTVSFNIVKGADRPTGIEPDGGTMTITFKRARKE
jgi:uncharacterized protein (TIGR03067 family)